MDLTNKIEKMAKQHGITHFGVASFSKAHDFILEQGGPIVTEFPISISLGITLLSAIVDQLPARSDRAVALSYRHHSYDVIKIAEAVLFLMSNGYTTGSTLFVDGGGLIK